MLGRQREELISYGVWTILEVLKFLLCEGFFELVLGDQMNEMAFFNPQSQNPKVSRGRAPYICHKIQFKQ